ncbi:Dual specificity protein kinase FUZ7 [Penicillium macrosclerotiorum]|uniref:Dual specificity protein kinase FUZ7 n=1 Tax=Penicillium macrosclerotiorum TaxID=303699 RepID=UPI002548FE20|nr:Dual specificity protein kinase FUZ7 [Penicillium macrosclerotiorum]KAJ5692125.1 Dual specificity protein kinase FUZ7 [Penicillium macrosclerotiorum]
MADPFKARTLKRKNVKGLALNAAPKANDASKPSDGDAQIPGAIGNADRTDTLEIGLEFRLDLRSEDLVTLKELGAGNGGTVSKVMHASTKVVMARKIIRVDAKENVRKQILRELRVGHDCNCPNIVTFYGAFQNEARDIVLCMEYMDCGSLDRISKDFGPVRVDVLGKITESVLAGLVYLYEVHRIMHRDIKPSNILVNSRGNIKLCDFGVATETVNSIADTFVGTSTYMAPERIQGGAYTVRSDVWSVGLTIMELAVGRFPFDTSDSAAGDRASVGPMGILDLLQQIVHESAPKLPKSDAFPPILHDFVGKCLLKKSEERPTPRELYDKDAFLQAAKRTPVDLQEWAISMMERHNRKSYLAPPAPKSLKETATPTSGGSSSPSPANSSKPSMSSKSSRTPQSQPSPYQQTPTSGDITVNIASDLPTPNRKYPQNQQYPSSHSPHSSHSSHSMRSPAPAPPSLEHLSLETKDDEESRYGRRPTRNYLNDPSSTLDAPSRPFMSPRSVSSHNTKSRTNLTPNALPIRMAPPPTQAPPPPPVSAGGSWRGYPGQMPTS